MRFKLVENVGIGYNRADLIQSLKDMGFNYKFDKYTDQQLFRILNDKVKSYEKDINDTVNNYENSKNKFNIIQSDDGLYHVLDGDTELDVFSSEDDLKNAGYSLEESSKRKALSKYKYPKNSYNNVQTKGMNVKKGNFDPDLNTRIFNKNTTINTSSSESSASAPAGGESAGGGGE